MKKLRKDGKFSRTLITKPQKRHWVKQEHREWISLDALGQTRTQGMDQSGYIGSNKNTGNGSVWIHWVKQEHREWISMDTLGQTRTQGMDQSGYIGSNKNTGNGSVWIHWVKQEHREWISLDTLGQTRTQGMDQSGCIGSNKNTGNGSVWIHWVKQEHREWISLDTLRAMGERSGATRKREWSTTSLNKQRKQHTQITLEFYRESVSICVMVKL